MSRHMEKKPLTIWQSAFTVLIWKRIWKQMEPAIWKLLCQRLQTMPRIIVTGDGYIIIWVIMIMPRKNCRRLQMMAYRSRTASGNGLHGTEGYCQCQKEI